MIRAKDYQFLIKLQDEFTDQVYKRKIDKDKIDCVRLMPNLLMTTALAKKHLRGEEESKANETVKQSIEYLQKAVNEGNVHKLIESAGPETHVILTLLLYPQLLI